MRSSLLSSSIYASCALVTSVLVAAMLTNTSAAEENALMPGASPKEAVTKWLDAMQSDRNTKEIVDSSLVALSPYCPSEKIDRYVTAIDTFRDSIASHVLEDESGESIRVHRFGGVVMRLTEPGKPVAKMVIAVAALKTEEGWKVPVGIQHFDNVLYGFDKKLRKQQAEVTRQLSALRRGISQKSENEIANEMLKLLRETRKTMRLDTLEPEKLALQFVYPKTPLTDIQRLSYLALRKNPSAADLRIALEVASDINRNTSAILQPNNAEKMAGILALRARAKRHGVVIREAVPLRNANPDDQVVNDKPDDLDRDKDLPRPLADMPWPANAVGTRQFREPGAIALMLPQSVRRGFGDLPEPFIEVVEKFISEDGEHMAISFGLFDHVIPGRFTVLPVYLRKVAGEWAVAIPDSAIFRGQDSSQRMSGAIYPPSDDSLEWHYDNDLDHLDKFSNSVVAFANSAGDTPKFQTAEGVVKTYLEAVTERDLLRCIRLTASRARAFSKDLEDLLSAIQHSYELLDPQIYEIHPADPKYAVQTHETAAMLWLARITRSNPGKIVANAVIAENAGDGDGWKISPGIHEVFPISARPNLEERKTLPLAEKQAEALAQLDQLRIAKEEEIRDACVADLFDSSIKINKIDLSSIKPTPALNTTEAQTLVEKLANNHIECGLIELIELSASLKTENPNNYDRVLQDIGNDRAFFRQVGDHLEAISSHIEGRWLGVIVRDSRMPSRTQKVDSPTTQDTLSMRLFVRYNNQWVPFLGGSLLKEINGGMKWINRRFISTVAKVIGDKEISDIIALKAILDQAPSNSSTPTEEAE